VTTLQLEQLDYQRHAIDAVVNAFEGQTPNTFDNSYFTEIQANVSDLSPAQFAQNLAAAAAANGIAPEDSHPSPVDADICVEMETGTGKTLVYIRTAFELHKEHGFTKFIILVPSVAIREGVMSTLKTFGPQLEALYATRLGFFEYDSRDLPAVRDFLSNPLPQIMVMTIQSFTSDEAVVNRPGRDDSVLGLSYLDAIGRTRPIVIMDEPQEGMDTDNAKRRLRVRAPGDTDPTPTLNPLVRLRYSATHKPAETRNLVYRLLPREAYNQRLVKKIEVLTVAEKSDEATLKLEIADIQTGAGTPKVKLKAWKLRSTGDHEWKDTAWLKGPEGRRPGDSIEAKTGNPSYRDYHIERIQKSLSDGRWRVKFTNGTELVQGERSGDREGLFRLQLHHLIRRHYQKKLGLDEHDQPLPPVRPGEPSGLFARGIKPLSLVFIDRVASYVEPDGLIRRLFLEELRALAPRYLGRTPADAELAAMHDGYFARTGGGEFTDSEAAMLKNKAAFDKIIRSRTALLALDEPIEFIFSHSALGVGWDNPNIFNIATLNLSYSDTKKRQEIGRGLRLCRDQTGVRVHDAADTPEGREINLLTVIPNETYETFALQYQEQIKEAYGSAAAGSPLRKNEKGHAKKKTVRRRDEVYTSPAFKAFWEKLARRTRYTVAFDEAQLIRRGVEALEAVTVAAYRAEIALNRIDHMAADGGFGHAHLGSATAALSATFAPTDLVEQLSDRTALARPTAFKILRALAPTTRRQLLKNPPVWLQHAVAALQRIEREEMLRALTYTPTAEIVPLTSLLESFETFRPVTPTPKRGLYDHAPTDSDIEADFATSADSDHFGGCQVVCFLKLPDDYVIPIPGHAEGYRPDWGVVLEQKSLAEGEIERFQFVVETKGTDLIDDARALTGDEQFKIRCAKKHFAALGVEAAFIAPVKSWRSFLEKTGLS
jgi:type III restriction enzyme